MLSFGAIATAATALDTIGVPLLRTVDPSLTGAGINVIQAEAPEDLQGNAWEVNPSAVGQPSNLLTWISGAGTASTFPNGVGIESGHADGVAGNFYGTSHGVAPAVAHVDNYEAGYFYETKILPGAAFNAKIVNQSFIFGSNPPQTTVDSAYDNYAAQNKTLFVSGLGNFGPPSAPATCYNGIGVGVSDGSSSVGPTTDNGRSKPDLVAPGGATSFSAPLVAGVATLLRQAGLRGDAGAGTTNSAVDIRTLKALLLNGAIKPSNWTHTATAPLDSRFGAGILNAFNSYAQLAAGEHSYIASTSNAPDGTHPPNSALTNALPLSGWDFGGITNQTVIAVLWERVNHYYFNVATNDSTFTATLAWNRQAGQTSAANLDLFLYNAATSNQVAASVSTVDNVEHIYVPKLPAGRYDLQVLKRVPAPLMLSEQYALAWEISAARLNIERVENQISLSWPIAPAGFRLQFTSSLNPPINWVDVAVTPAVSNAENHVTLDAASAAQFFRLVRP